MTDLTVLEATERIEPITDKDEARLNALESKVNRAMTAAGKIAGDALREIRDSRLYRATHTSFEAYCSERFDISRSTAYRMMDEGSKAIGAGQSVPPRDTSTKRTTTTQEPVTLDPEPETFTPKPPKPKKPKPEAVVPDVILGVPDQATEAQVHSIGDAMKTGRIDPVDLSRITVSVNGEDVSGKVEEIVFSPRHWFDTLLTLIRSVEVEDFIVVAKPSEAAEILAWAGHFRPLRSVGKPPEAPQPVEEASVDTEGCDHPVTRRLGRNCGVCGQRV